MIAGGLGNVRRKHVEKREIPAGAKIVVLGGPAMLIGLGGGAASSMAQRRVERGSRLRLGAARQPGDRAARQEVIDRCWALGRRQPDPLDPRRRRRRPVERAARARRTTAAAARASSCARSRATSRACRRWRSGATRRRSATCSRSRRTTSTRFAAIVRARALPVRGGRRRDRRRPARASTIRSSATRPVDMPLDVLLGKPPRMRAT